MSLLFDHADIRADSGSRVEEFHCKCLDDACPAHLPGCNGKKPRGLGYTNVPPSISYSLWSSPPFETKVPYSLNNGQGLTKSVNRQLHTVGAVDGFFNSGSLESGASFTYTFTQAGEFEYFCLPHPWMRAKVIVER